jgi:CRISPR-associated protein Csm3
MPGLDNTQLFGRIIITGNIKAVTGLHIGKGKEGVMIGGVDNPVIRDTLTDLPYIPGSSLKGKLRSLAEKRSGKKKNFPKNSEVQIHVCEEVADYSQCVVCRIYGVPGNVKPSAPTRLVVRDTFLEEKSKKRLKEEVETDLPYTELKYEVMIDRITSEANPRPLERVPADSVFGPFEMIFSLYDQGDPGLLPKLFEAMRLLEDDYLGGSGSRGSGKVRFEGLKIAIKPVSAYGEEKPQLTAIEVDNTEVLRAQEAEIVARARELIPQ